jgi:hypothetical protein
MVLRISRATTQAPSICPIRQRQMVENTFRPTENTRLRRPKAGVLSLHGRSWTPEATARSYIMQIIAFGSSVTMISSEVNWLPSDTSTRTRNCDEIDPFSLPPV